MSSSTATILEQLGFGFPTPHALYLALGAFTTSYLLLVRSLRYRRVRQLPKQFGYDNLSEAEIYEKITLQDAQDINKVVESFEFPFSYNTSLQFALFRTYAIPTISRVLRGTRQFSTTSRAGRRYVDTVVLIIEFSNNALDSDRGSTALARMNHLHSLYPAIQPSDLLYTLMLFITSPPLFLNRYEWRQTTPLEKAAIVKFWTEVGVRMKIPRETIPKTFDDCVNWAEEYEKKFMVHAPSNTYVAEKTIDLLLYYVPTRPLRQFGRKLVISLLDERLRLAMDLPPVGRWIHILTSTALWARAMFIRHLMLPRFHKRQRVTPEPDPKTGRYGLLKYDNEPWYVPRGKGLWDRWGPFALYCRLGGWPLPGDDGFQGEGYEIIDVGPLEYVGKGREWVEGDAERVRGLGGYERDDKGQAATRRGGCPFG